MNASVEYGRSQFQVRLHDKKKRQWLTEMSH